jgi:hypothetical protein
MSGEIEASHPGVTFGRIVGSLVTVLVLLAAAAEGQTLTAVDDSFGVPFSQILEAEAPGVLANDTFNGEPAEDHGATVVLILDASDGVLSLATDGSFTYDPDVTFPGVDSFTYEADVGGTTSQATVILSACDTGPAVFTCWMEAPYLAKLGELGYSTFLEGFEDDAAWGSVRTPDTAPTVVSQGIAWQTNHPDPPASNEITTGPGPALTGLWGVFDPDHGYATGTPEACNIPTPDCLFKDGFTGTRQSGWSTLFGVGGHFTGQAQPNLVFILDGGAPIGGGRLIVGGEQFFGVIDIAGFTSFRVEETDGKVGQERYVFADDFTIAHSGIFSDGFESGGMLAWSAIFP